MWNRGHPRCASLKAPIASAMESQRPEGHPLGYTNDGRRDQGESHIPHCRCFCNLFSPRGKEPQRSLISYVNSFQTMLETQPLISALMLDPSCPHVAAVAAHEAELGRRRREGLVPRVGVAEVRRHSRGKYSFFFCFFK